MPSNALAALVRAHAPRRPWCAEVKHAARVRSFSTAVRAPYIQLNPPAQAVWMVLDIDRPNAASAWDDAGLPPPTYVAINKANGHAHLGYALAEPVCTTDVARRAPLRYLEAIEHAFITRLGADALYSGPLAKNPLHSTWQIWEPANAPTFELGYLAEFVDLSKRPPPRPAGVGRNCDLFDGLRHWAYSAIRSYWRPGGEDDWWNAVRRHAESLNEFPIPLGNSEVAGIARSVARATWRFLSPQGFSAVQSERGRRSGEVRRANSADRRARAQELASGGHSHREIAKLLGVSHPTVGTWLRESGK